MPFIPIDAGELIWTSSYSFLASERKSQILPQMPETRRKFVQEVCPKGYLYLRHTILMFCLARSRLPYGHTIGRSGTSSQRPTHTPSRLTRTFTPDLLHRRHVLFLYIISRPFPQFGKVGGSSSSCSSARTSSSPSSHSITCCKRSGRKRMDVHCRSPAGTRFQHASTTKRMDARKAYHSFQSTFIVRFEYSDAVEGSSATAYTP